MLAAFFARAAKNHRGGGVPVVFGRQIIATAATAPGSDGRCFASMFTLGTAITTVQKLTAHFQANIGAGWQCKLVIYSDNAGQPGTLLAVSSAVTPAGNGWSDFPVAPGVALPAGNYFLGVLYNSFESVVTGATTAGAETRMANGTVPYAAPINWPGTTVNYNQSMCIYCTGIG